MGNFVNEGQAIIWRAPIVNKALTQLMRDVYWDEPDFIIVDMPPGTGDVALTVAQMIPKAEALVVTTPQADAARVAVKAGKMAVQAHLKVAGVVENMGHAVCPCCGEEMRIFGGDGGDRVAGELGSSVMGRIPILPDATGEPGNALFDEDSRPGPRLRRDRRAPRRHQGPPADKGVVGQPVRLSALQPVSQGAPATRSATAVRRLSSVVDALGLRLFATGLRAAEDGVAD